MATNALVVIVVVVVVLLLLLLLLLLELHNVSFYVNCEM